jgi:hypothetical protein
MSSSYHHQAVEIAAQGPTLRMRINGTSMAPLLKNGEAVMIQPIPTESLQIGDMIAFRQDGQIITHRLVATQQNVLITMGDNVYALDPPISAEKILGKVTACQIADKEKTLFGGHWKIIHPALAWLGWQGASPHRTGWFARFPRAMSWLARAFARILLKF